VGRVREARGERLRRTLRPPSRLHHHAASARRMASRAPPHRAQSQPTRRQRTRRRIVRHSKRQTVLVILRRARAGGGFSARARSTRNLDGDAQRAEPPGARVPRLVLCFRRVCISSKPSSSAVSNASD
jgi:hypothetical protein